VKKLMCILFAALVVLVGTTAAQTKSAKIAYVNSETILRELPEAVAVRQELEATIQSWQEELEKMGKELQEGVADYQKKQAMMDPKTKAEREQSLQELQQRAREFQQKKFDQREGEAVKLREQKFAPVQAKVLKAIAVVAKEDGFSYVFDKLENATNLLYADAQYDLTYKVLDRLKRGAGSAKDSKNKQD
jgi:outer membrane protein